MDAKIEWIDEPFGTKNYRLNFSEEQYGFPDRFVQVDIKRYVKGVYGLSDGTVGNFEENLNICHHVRLFFSTYWTFHQAVHLFKSLGFLNSSKVRLLAGVGEETSIKRGTDVGKSPLIISELDQMLTELIGYYDSAKVRIEGFRPMSWEEAFLSYGQRKSDKDEVKREIIYFDTLHDKQVFNQILEASAYQPTPEEKKMLETMVEQALLVK